MFRFTIREILLVTLIVALAVGWWLDRNRLAPRAKESDSFRALSEFLASELQAKNPAASLEIAVNGKGVVSSKSYTDPAPQALAPKSSCPR